MKKILLSLAALAVTGMMFAQSDPISSVFDKYTGQEGFIAITLTGDMLKMAAEMQEYKKDTTLLSELSELKVLVHENDDEKSDVNLYDEVYKLIDKSVFKELMTVKEEDTDVTMLARENNGVISEFILLVGGDDDNVLIQAKGNILLRELADMSGNFNFSGLEQLKKMGK
jgi:hypothetical protein